MSNNPQQPKQEQQFQPNRDYDRNNQDKSRVDQDDEKKKQPMQSGQKTDR